MTLETAFIFTISLILLWIKPGPGQAIFINIVLKDGFWAGMSLVTGTLTVCVLFFITAAMGSVFIQFYIDKIGLIFKLFGAGYLFYLGYQGIKDIQSGLWQKKKEPKKKRFIQYFTMGALMSLANPFVIFFFIGLLPLLVPIGDLTTSDIIIGSLIIIFAGGVTDAIMGMLAEQVKITLSDTAFIKKINLITSIGFLMIGAFLLFSALTEFDGAFLIN